MKRGPVRVVILGAAGRDFHDFNTVYRDDPAFEVVAFTAAQIPGIDDRRYPATLCGTRYPQGIPIMAEASLEAILRNTGASLVVFAYSDMPHAGVMHLASRALAAGADFTLLGPTSTMLRSRLPVIAVSAVRTGCGKSQVARYLSRLVRARGLRTAVIRHPMPYGNLEAQRVQCFRTRDDLARAQCTIEEREEYEPHLAAGNAVYAGVDYAAVLALAEAESDVVIWDGGNNDFPFIRPDLHIALTDALRPGNEASHHPGEAVLRMADIIVVAKADSVTADQGALAMAEARAINPRACILRGASPVTLDDPEAVRGRRVLVVEDGPTITHGSMPYGAAFVAATRARAGMIIDPRPHAAPTITAVYAAYPHIGPVLPAIGYSPAQQEALRATIVASNPEVVVAGTPIDLGALMSTPVKVVRARYEFAEMDEPGLDSLVDSFLGRVNKATP